MNDRRGSWYLLTGLILGAALGIFYAWVIQPVEYVNTVPASLRPDQKDEYRLLIALAFAVDADLSRAQARLAVLGDADPAQILSAQAQQANADGLPTVQVRAIGFLVAALADPSAGLPEGFSLAMSVSPTPTAPRTATATPRPSPTATKPRPTARQATVSPQVTNTPRPTSTSTATAGNPFILDSRLLLCDLNQSGPLLTVLTLDADGRGVPGVEIILTWADQEEHFFTGLKPELGLGYADYAMTPAVEYTLRLADGSQLIPGILAAECEAGNGQRIWGTWQMNFIQP